MMLENNECYEFGDCALFPKARTLTRFNRSIPLAARDFDILIYLVRNAGKVVRDSDIIAAVWGEGAKISEGNITNHISKVRRALNGETNKSRYIVTFHGRSSYKFIPTVKISDKEYYRGEESQLGLENIPVEVHLIAPVFLGTQAYDNLRGEPSSSLLGEYKEIKIEGGRLHVTQTGIAVWHLKSQHAFKSFSEAARWRKQVYDEMLIGKHIVHLFNQELKVPLVTRSSDIFSRVVGKIGYVFSLMILADPKWARPDNMGGPLRLLANLGSLINASKGVEARLLTDPGADLQTLAFGAPGQDVGFASWDGVSYLKRADHDSVFIDAMVDFEMAVQTTWWLAKCLYDAFLLDGVTPRGDLEAMVDKLRLQHARLRSIEAIESTSQRTMIEAILKTSRLDRLVQDTIRLIKPN